MVIRRHLVSATVQTVDHRDQRVMRRQAGRRVVGVVADLVPRVAVSVRPLVRGDGYVVVKNWRRGLCDDRVLVKAGGVQRDWGEVGPSQAHAGAGQSDGDEF